MKKYSFIILLLFCFSLFRVEAKAPVASVPLKSASPLIVLDPGHGGADLGARIKYPHCEEKRLSLSVAQLTKKYLDQMGYRVILTRTSDVFVPLDRRVYVANSAHAGIFVSIHFNSCPNPQASGMEIFFNPDSQKKSKMDASRKLATQVIRKTAAKTQIKSRGVKKAGYCVIRDTKMPAVLLECGFLTNPEERDKLRQREYQDKLARGIAEGIDRFMKAP